MNDANRDDRRSLYGDVLTVVVVVVFVVALYWAYGGFNRPAGSELQYTGDGLRPAIVTLPTAGHPLDRVGGLSGWTPWVGSAAIRDVAGGGLEIAMHRGHAAAITMAQWVNPIPIPGAVAARSVSAVIEFVLPAAADNDLCLDLGFATPRGAIDVGAMLCRTHERRQRFRVLALGKGNDDKPLAFRLVPAAADVLTVAVAYDGAAGKQSAWLAGDRDHLQAAAPPWGSDRMLYLRVLAGAINGAADSGGRGDAAVVVRRLFAAVAVTGYFATVAPLRFDSVDYAAGAAAAPLVWIDERLGLTPLTDAATAVPADGRRSYSLAFVRSGSGRYAAITAIAPEELERRLRGAAVDAVIPAAFLAQGPGAPYRFVETAPVVRRRRSAGGDER